MTTHTSSINFKKFIQDMADMYPFEVATVVITELVANSLDSGATRISINYNPRDKILIVSDNGKGMSAVQFDEYHDFAAGFKTRGTGIGFAGLGSKISFNIADCVETETQSGSFSGGSKWYLKSKGKLIWEDIKPKRIRKNGTRVEVAFRSEIAPPYSSSEDLVDLLRRHYLPLLDRTFLNLYEELDCYSKNLRFIINGKVVEPSNIVDDLSLSDVRKFFPKKAGKMVGYGVLGLAREEYQLGADVCGVLMCTYGKVIKVDLFNQFPSNLGPRIFGVVEIPTLINFVTTAKTDFLRKRGNFKTFEKLYDPVRQEFKDWLKELGVEQINDFNKDTGRKLEREIKKLLDEIPELSEFFGFRTKKVVLQQKDNGSIVAELCGGSEVTFPNGKGVNGEEPGPLDVGDQPGEALVETGDNTYTRAEPISRIGRRGPKISFATVPDRTDMAWVDGNNIIINSGHPCYERISRNNLTLMVYSLFAIASAVQRFSNTNSEDKKLDLMLIDRIMAAWGKK